MRVVRPSEVESVSSVWPVRSLAGRRRPVSVGREGSVVTLDVPAGHAELGQVATGELIDLLHLALSVDLVPVLDGVARYRQSVPVPQGCVLLDVAASPAGTRLGLGDKAVRLSPLDAMRFRSGLNAACTAGRGGAW